MTVAEAGYKGGKARLRKMTAEDRKRVATLGGQATAKKLSAAERSKAASKAAIARWAKVNHELKQIAKTAEKKARERKRNG